MYLRMWFACTEAVRARSEKPREAEAALAHRNIQSPAVEELIAKALLHHNTLEKIWSWYKRQEVLLGQGMLFVRILTGQ